MNYYNIIQLYAFNFDLLSPLSPNFVQFLILSSNCVLVVCLVRAILTTNYLSPICITFWIQFLRAAMKAMRSKGEEKEMAEKQIIEALEKIHEQLKGNKYFGGYEKIGYLDIAVGWISYWLPLWEEVGCMKILNPEELPAITGWITRFLDHPDIKYGIPSKDKMLEYFHHRSQVVYGHNGSSGK